LLTALRHFMLLNMIDEYKELHLNATQQTMLKNLEGKSFTRKPT